MKISLFKNHPVANTGQPIHMCEESVYPYPNELIICTNKYSVYSSLYQEYQMYSKCIRLAGTSSSLNQLFVHNIPAVSSDFAILWDQTGQTVNFLNTYLYEKFHSFYIKGRKFHTRKNILITKIMQK